ncbi:MAG: gamma-glutamyltransferase [Gammaproteobacteria bacterium]|nr:gamma-glutamyltransferase [Gammaproteobacteria bacterium]
MATVAQATVLDEPERATGWRQKQAVSGTTQAVVTANPWASRAAWWALERGGTAADAVVAAQWVLTLVEPQSSGLGGGAFMLYYDADTRQLFSYDGRETAPAAVRSGSYVDDDGTPRDWWSIVASGHSVGVPGVVAMLGTAHRRYGRLPWSALVKPAQGLAERGVAVSPRLAGLLRAIPHPNLASAGAAQQYFFPDGQPLAAGVSLRNPPLAQTLGRLGEQGPDSFYRGTLAAEMVNAVKAKGGVLSEADLADYQPRQRQPLCSQWRQYRVCSMGPPSSGGLALLQILQLWQRTAGAVKADFATAANAHRFTQILRLVFADRDSHVGDPDYDPVPVDALLEPAYLDAQARRITRQDQGPLATGLPAPQRQAKTLERPSTTHLSVVDRWGNAASMTSSIEMGFGSGLMAGGFLFNNQLTDFSFGRGQLVNGIEPGKRPRSSMTPVVVFDSAGEVRLVIGSPGGSRIIPYVAWALLAYLDGGMGLQEALDLGHVANLNGDYTELEQGTEVANWAPVLRQRGHRVKVVALDSGIHAISREDGRWVAAADGRREGLAMAR